MDDATGLSQTRCILARNDWFGEVGVINQAPRNASVISRGLVVLLVFSDVVCCQSNQTMGGARIFAVWGQSQWHSGQNRACP